MIVFFFFLISFLGFSSFDLSLINSSLSSSSEAGCFCFLVIGLCLVPEVRRFLSLFERAPFESGLFDNLDAVPFSVLVFFLRGSSSESEEGGRVLLELDGFLVLIFFDEMMRLLSSEVSESSIA